MKRFALWYFRDNWWTSSCAKAICTKSRSHIRQWTDYASAGCSDSSLAITRYQILEKIRSSITDDACKTLVHALVTARLDYANSLLYGLPQTTLERLQHVQNCTARLVCILENITTSRQCCSICTGYQFVCTRHINCVCLLIRWCMTMHCVTSRNYYPIVATICTFM